MNHRSAVIDITGYETETRYTYDNGNRLTRVDYLKDASAETFGYDPAGDRDAAVSYVFHYDRLNRLDSKTDSRGRSLSPKAGTFLVPYMDSSSVCKLAGRRLQGTTAYVYPASVVGTR